MMSDCGDVKKVFVPIKDDTKKIMTKIILNR